MSWLSDRRVMWPSGFIYFLFFCTGLLLVVQFIFRSWDPPPSPNAILPHLSLRAAGQ